MPTKTLSERPSKVALAVKFFYLVVGAGIIYAGSLYLIYQLNKGRNWARWWLLVIFIIAIPLVILPAFASYSHNPVDALIAFIQTALYIIGMVFLFHRSSSNWFGAEKISKKSEG